MNRFEINTTEIVLIFFLLLTLIGCDKDVQKKIELETAEFKLKIPELEGKFKPEGLNSEDVERYSKRFKKGKTKRIEVTYKKDSATYNDWINSWSVEELMMNKEDYEINPYTIEIIKVYDFNERVWEVSKVTFIREDTLKYHGEVIYLRRLFSKESEVTLEIINEMSLFDYIECVQYFEKYKGIELSLK